VFYRLHGIGVEARGNFVNWYLHRHNAEEIDARCLRLPIKLNFDLVGSYFNVAVWLAWSNVPDSYAGGSVATGRAVHARQVKGDDRDKKGYPGLPGWGVGRGANNPTS
jgi:hypothetical protein